MNIARKSSREAIDKDLNAILFDWKDLVDQYRKAEGEEKEKLAAEVYKQQLIKVSSQLTSIDKMDEQIKIQNSYMAELNSIYARMIAAVGGKTEK